MTLTHSGVKSAFEAQFTGIFLPDISVVAIKWATAYSNFVSVARNYDSVVLDPIPPENFSGLRDAVSSLLNVTSGPVASALAQGYFNAVKNFWLGDGVTSYPLTFDSGGDTILASSSFLLEDSWVETLTGVFSNTDWVGYTPQDRRNDYYQNLLDITLGVVTYLGPIS